MERPESLSFAAPSPGVQNTNQAVTPDNPIPARVRDVSPAWPSQFLGEPFNVAVSVKVALDGDGGVIDVVGAECVVSETPSTATRDAVCHAFFDAAAAAVRQWRYERPVRVPLQFFVIVSFRKGSDPAIMQSLRSLPIEATPTFAGAAFSARYNREPPVRTEELLRGLARELNAVVQEVTRLRNQMPPGSDTVQLERSMPQLKQDLSRVEAMLQDVIAGRESPGTQIQPVQSGPSDGPALAAPSGRPVYRAGDRFIPTPRLIRNVPPVYTPEAMAARVEGFVVMEALVDEQGRVPVARVIRSIPLLDQAALDAAKQWLFTPTIVNGEPVPVLVQVQMRFDMRTTAGPR